MLESVLIANRGEIALRIVRACRELGVRSVAVFSEPDRSAPHVLEADEAHLIGPAASSESYLKGDRIIDVARRVGAEAIHPGYGFLAERAPFARAVEEAGLVFVGPAADTIHAMGDKTEARRRMATAEVPIVPGVVDPVTTPGQAEEIADELGYPVLLKAAAGGGGKGMRVVSGPEEIASAFEAAGREALSAFGDASVYIEKYLDAPRHIEIQVVGDATGKVLHLGERSARFSGVIRSLWRKRPHPF